MVKAFISDKQPVAAKNQTADSTLLTPADVRTLVEAILRERQGQPRSEIIGFADLVKRLPLGERSIREGIKDGLIPTIRLPGGRRLLFDWEVVVNSLRRFEKGGLH